MKITSDFLTCKFDVREFSSLGNRKVQLVTAKLEKQYVSPQLLKETRKEFDIRISEIS